MSDGYNSSPVPFTNKGLVQKQDPSQLAPGQYYQMDNAWSQQEGALVARTGHQQLSPSPGLASPIRSLSKLNLAGADSANPRYLGSGTSIYRALPSGSYTPTSVFSGLTADARWTAMQYNAGTSGTPSLFFGTQDAALRDTRAGTPYTTLQKWGVDPPPIPVSAVLNIPLTPADVDAFVIQIPAPDSLPRFVTSAGATPESDASGFKHFTAISAGIGYNTFTPDPAGPTNGVNGVYAQMLLKLTDVLTLTSVSVAGAVVTYHYAPYTTGFFLPVGQTILIAGMTGANNGTFTVTGQVVNTSFTVAHVAQSPETHAGTATCQTETIVVSTVTATTFTAVTHIPHVAGSTTANGTQLIDDSLNNDAGSGSLPPWFVTISGLSINASFSGTAANGYSSDDPFHIGLRCTNISDITQIEIRIVPNSNSSFPTNYYFFDVIPATAMTASPADDNPAWLEMNIPKNSFKKAGSAGTGAWTWQNINQVIIVVNSQTAIGSVGASNMYFIGGGGLNSSAAGTLPYDWLYIYRNPTTGAVGNPCPVMATANLPPPITNGQVTLTLTGTVQAATIANGIGEISGPGSIKIYRRGGTFADGLYRRVGYAANPGGDGTNGATVTFVDNASDASLDQAETIEFDNDPPVPSSLPVALTASIIGFLPQGGGSGNTQNTPNTISRLQLDTLPTNFNAVTIASTITVGSTVQVGFGTTFELCIVTFATFGGGFAFIECFLQNTHSITSLDPSETVEVDTALRGNCNLVHQDFDCLFLAGDTNNPATLYQSKVGRPEAFPVINLISNFAQQINVGSPSNPINGITSIGPGELVCLNLDNIFIVQVWAGQMQIPIQAPATRGLYSKWCWCKGDNRIWYLGYDGIYTWAGGQSQKVSEQIDYLFKNQTVNGIAPIDMSQASLFSFAYAENVLFISVVIKGSNIYRRLRYETLYNRWTIDTIYDNLGGVYGIGSMFTEPDTGNFLLGITNVVPKSYLWLCDFFSTTDGWTSVITDGIPINYTIWRYWPLGDFGDDFQVGEIALEMANNSDSVAARLYYNYSTSITQTITISSGTTATRGRFIQAVNSGTPQVAYSFGLALVGSTGTTATPVAFYTLDLRALKLEQVTTGPTLDWDDLGYPYDKFLQDVTIQYDTGGQSVVVSLDTVNGITGNTQNLAVATYTLSGSQRSQQVYAVPDQTVAKLVRFRPAFASTKFKWWKYSFRKIEYPPDVVVSTPWEDDGYLLPKYAQEIMLEVDTANQIVPVQIQADGTTIQTVNVQTTTTDRHRNITLNPTSAGTSTSGKQWRILVNTAAIPAGGKFQLFQAKWQFQKADAGPVGHTFDYDDLGWPFDKLLQTVTIEFDTFSGGSFVVNMDTLTGIDGNTLTVDAQQFTLPAPSGSSGRGKKTFAITANTIVKMVRLYPVSDTVGSKQWSYKFNKVDYPADTVLSTDWNNSGYGCDKTFKVLTLQIDTGGVACSVQFQVDGSTPSGCTFSVNTTSNTRDVILTIPSNVTGKQWRLLTTPGNGGKAQLFGVQPQFEKQPCAITHFDSLMQVWGSEGYKGIWQIWVDYQSAVTLTLKIYRDGDVLFYTKTLPAQTSRNVFRFYLPTLNGSQLNKSISYQVLIDASDNTTPFQMYRDGSRVEIRQFSTNQRSSFDQKIIWELIPLEA